MGLDRNCSRRLRFFSSLVSLDRFGLGVWIFGSIGVYNTRNGYVVVLVGHGPSPAGPHSSFRIASISGYSISESCSDSDKPSFCSIDCSYNTFSNSVSISSVSSSLLGESHSVNPLVVWVSSNSVLMHFSRNSIAFCRFSWHRGQM